MTDEEFSLRYWSKGAALMQYDGIWKVLTISLLPSDFPIEVFRSYFSVLWTREGRGVIANLALIAWLDSNVDFRYLSPTLAEWSQKAIIKKQQHTGEQLDVFAAMIVEVLGGGMRFTLWRMSLSVWLTWS